MRLGKPMITKCGNGTFWVLTGEDVDLDYIRESMEPTNREILDLLERIYAALSKGAD